MKTNLIRRIFKIAGTAAAVLAVGFGLLLGVSYAIYYSPAPAELPCRNCAGEAAQHMHQTLPNSTLVRFERSGHWPYLEEPERFRQVLGQLLSE